MQLQLSAEDAASMLLLPTEAAPLMVPRVYVWASVGAVIVLIVAVVAVVRLLRTVMRADADGETSEAARKIAGSRPRIVPCKGNTMKGSMR